MQTKNQTSLTRNSLYGIILLGIFFSAFGVGNLPVARAQDVENINLAGIEMISLLSTDANNDPVIVDYSLGNFGENQKTKISNFLNENISQINTRYRNFTVTVQYDDAEGVQHITLFPKDVYESFWELPYEDTDIITLTARFIHNAVWEISFEPTPSNDVTSFSTPVYSFPWTGGHSWKKTQGFHSYNLGYSIDFSPNTNTVLNVLSIEAGTLETMCYISGDSDQGMVRIVHDNGDRSGYLHLAKNTIPSNKFNTRISKGEILGSLYTGSAKYNPPSACPNLSSYKFYTPCGCGTATHLHFETNSLITIQDTSLSTISSSPNGTFYQSNNSGGTPSLTLTLGSTLRNHQVTIELQTIGPIIRPVFTGSTTSDTNGNITNYSLINVPPGTYYLLVKPQGWLRKGQQPVTLISGSNSVNFGSTFQSCGNGAYSCAGDVNGDNHINVVDIGIVVDDYDTSASRSDINRDGVVNIVDIGIIVDAYGLYGDGGETPIAGATVPLAATDTATSQLTLTVAQPASPAQVGEIVTLNLDYDTAGLEMAGVSAVIDYDECVLQPLTDQITDSGIFSSNGIISTPGTLDYRANSSVGEAPVSGTGRVASIPFRYIAGVSSSTTVAIRFRPDSAWFSTMDQDSIHQPILSAVNNIVLFPTGNPQRSTRSANVTTPLPGDTLNQSLVRLQAQASDPCNGMHQVTFHVYYDGQWHDVGTDTDGTDGWEMYWDASQITDQVIKVKAFAGDFAGNGVESAVNENIVLDRTPPTPKFDILYNGGFEEGYTVTPGEYPYGWQKDAWIIENSTFLWDSSQKHSGNKSVKISNNLNNDASWIQIVEVQPNSDYRLSGWIKTENIGQSPANRGANLSYGTFLNTPILSGTNDWTFVFVDFNSGINTQLTIAARLGMASGDITGTAWFDDVKLELLSLPTCHSLTTNVNPSESGIVLTNPSPNCENGTQYVHGTVVTLTATPNIGYTFSNWIGASTANDNPTTVTMTSNKSVMANLSSPPLLTLTLNSMGVYDGQILETTETSGKGGTIDSTATRINLGDDVANKQYRAILSFDTSSLPDNAVITSATLKFKYAGKAGTLPFSTHGNLMADIRKGSFSNNATLQANDFKAGASKNNVLAFTNSMVSNWFSQSLAPANFQYVNLSNVTQFRLRFQTDDNHDFGADLLKIFSSNAGASGRPKLIIEYYVP